MVNSLLPITATAGRPSAVAVAAGCTAAALCRAFERSNVRFGTSARELEFYRRSSLCSGRGCCFHLAFALLGWREHR